MGGKSFNWIGLNIPFECSVNGISGHGMAMFWYPNEKKSLSCERHYLRIKRLFFNNIVTKDKLVSAKYLQRLG